MNKHNWDQAQASAEVYADAERVSGDERSGILAAYVAGYRRFSASDHEYPADAFGDLPHWEQTAAWAGWMDARLRYYLRNDGSGG